MCLKDLCDLSSHFPTSTLILAHFPQRATGLALLFQSGCCFSLNPPWSSLIAWELSYHHIPGIKGYGRTACSFLLKMEFINLKDSSLKSWKHHKPTFITSCLLLHQSHWGSCWRLAQWMAPTFSCFGFSLYSLITKQKMGEKHKQLKTCFKQNNNLIMKNSCTFYLVGS